MESIIIDRPLFFLCGPWIELEKDDEISPKTKKTNRRLILSNYISSKKIGDKLRPLPIIVDELFKYSNEIEKYKLNTGLLEEIVSSISCKTYIFLDTMSTSFELGLFTNSKQRSNVKILLDDKYSIRSNCKVGEYITKSQGDFIKYPARYETKDKYIYFKDDLIPKQISSDVDDVVLQLEKQIENPLFFTKDFITKEKTGLIRYKIDNFKLTFNTDIKTLFYLAGDKYLERVTEDIDFEKEIDSLKKFILDSLLVSFVKKSNDYLVYDIVFDSTWEFELTIDNYEIDDILRNIFYIIYVMKTKKLTINNNSVKMPFSRSKKCNQYKRLNQQGFWKLQKSDINLINKYIDNQDDFVNHLEVFTNGKKRNIFSYKDTSYGKKLRLLHESLNRVLDILPTSKYSYAYVHDRCPKQCLNQHLESSYFLKMDISKFFESIRLTRLVDFIKEWQIDQCNRFVREHSIFKHYWYIFTFSDDINLKKICKAMMVKYSVVLGFVTSPKVSNFYLYKFDLEISKELEKNGIVYTRYADDLLISSNNSFSSENIIDSITSKLNHIKLRTNTSKTKKYSILNDGDTVKFLGLMIKMVGTKRIITISNSYLLKIVKTLKKKISTFGEKEHIYGMIMHVKYTSPEAYNKLSNLIEIKLHNKIDYYVYWLLKDISVETM